LGKTNAIKHTEGFITYFRNHLNPNLSQWKEGSHDFYLWIWVSRGAVPDLFVYVVHAAPVGSKQENESLFQNLIAYIVEVQTLRGIVLLGGDFNAPIATLPNTIDTSDLCEMLQALELIETEHPSVVVKRQNHNAIVGG
jgi:sulfur relay (sulfurtransferase) DsrF/TusC family protein